MSLKTGQTFAIFSVSLIALAYVFRGAFNSKIADDYFRDALLDYLGRKRCVPQKIEKASGYARLLQRQVYHVELVTRRGHCMKGYFVVSVPFLAASRFDLNVRFRKEWRPKR